MRFWSAEIPVSVQVEPLLRQAQALHRDGRLADAVAAYESVLALDAEEWTSLHALASIALQNGELGEAIRRYGALIERRSDFSEGHYKRGNAFNRLGHWPAALADYDRAVALNPSYANALCNRGTVLERLTRWDEALASYDSAIALNPTDAFAHYNRAGVLKEMNRFDEAMGSYDRAIALNEGYIEAYVNRGHLLQKLARLEDAAASYGRAIELCPEPAAVPRPEQKYLLGLRRQVLMQICDWLGMDADLQRIAEGLRAQLPVTLPLPVLAMFDAPSLHHAAAKSWIREESPADPALGPLPVRSRSPKIRIGYFSADFRAHPVAFLTAGLFEHHDRSKFDITAFAFGPEANDAVQTRLTKAFDRFVDVRQRTDMEVAAMAREFGIDIAVDLNGITEHSRTKIFALRAAPIQVNYLGYPGTLGATYMDYLIGDRMVIPRTHQGHYAEKIIYLPDSFVPFDATYEIADKAFTRAELGLPAESFVFCCFNNTFKITPLVFDSWMRILGRTEHSVLWLPATNAAAVGNLRKEAARRGVDAGRLIFAARMAALPEHLARLRAADLFLDTFPYNAHATALDALWAGLPVLTCRGHSFASRVASSMLQTMDLPELIADSIPEYEAMARQLAADPVRISLLRRRVAEHRATAPLFNTALYTKNLEAAYATVYDRYHSGAAVEHIGYDLSCGTGDDIR